MLNHGRASLSCAKEAYMLRRCRLFRPVAGPAFHEAVPTILPVLNPEILAGAYMTRGR